MGDLDFEKIDQTTEYVSKFADIDTLIQTLEIIAGVHPLIQGKHFHEYLKSERLTELEL
jgi:hypothetical protein